MKSVVISGSTKFSKEIKKFANELRKLGVKVYEPVYDWGADEWDSLSLSVKSSVTKGLTYDHFEKIKKADLVFIYNKNGYVGNSTTLELGFAVALSKIVIAFHSDEEIFRNELYEGFANTPKKLLEFL